MDDYAIKILRGLSTAEDFFIDIYCLDPLDDIWDPANWIKAIVNDTDPVVRPEQAYVVSQILEAIYESSKTGKPVFFD